MRTKPQAYEALSSKNAIVLQDGVDACFLSFF